MSSPEFPGGQARSSTQVWDQLSEQGRREQLDSMDPEAVRSMAVSMPVIEQAKGILMGCYGGDAASAFAVLVRRSSATNVKLRDLATLVVEAARTASTSGSGPSPCLQVGRVLQEPHAVDDQPAG